MKRCTNATVYETFEYDSKKEAERHSEWYANGHRTIDSIKERKNGVIVITYKTKYDSRISVSESLATI